MERIDRTVQEASLQLFSSYGISLRTESSAGEPPYFDLSSVTASKITWGGDKLKGTLLIASSFDFVASTIPGSSFVARRSTSASDWIHVRDWTKELVNQLLGRVKNKLAAYDIAIDQSLPSALSGRSGMIEIQSKNRLPLRLSNESGLVLIWVDATAKPGVVLSEVDQTINVQRERTVVIF